MKALALLFAAGMACIAQAIAADPPKQLLILTAKPHVVDSERDLRGRHGNVRRKSITLRVEISNATSSAVGESQLSGHVLITRANDLGQKVVRDPIGSLKVPAMKPNEKLTFDLGRIELSEVNTRLRKFEESLDEWKVTCTQNGNEIGKAVSSDRYESLEKQVTSPVARKQGPAKARHK